MSEINIKETRFVPDKPNVIKKEQIEVYIPTGGYKKPGIVSFDTTGFIVDPLGHVKLRRNSVRNISNFEIDVTTGILTVYYDDGTISNINIPVKTDRLYSRNNLITTIDIGPGSFVLDDNTGHWFVPITNRLTGFKDDKFIASLELAGRENSVDGYYTVPDTLFKGKDGSLLISVDSEEEKDNFNGRLLLLGGEIFTDNQIVSMVYEPEKRLFTVLKTDGTRYYINAINEEYLKDYVNQRTSSVYVAKGNIEFSKLPSTEELATGDYLGFVYNVVDDFVADIRFDSVSYGKSFSAGTNIVVARNDDGTYQFDVLGTMGGMVDLSDYISNKGGTIHGGLIFDGVNETIYSSIDANEFKFANANKELSVNLSNITLYDVGTSTYIYVDYPTQSGRLIVDTDYATSSKAGVGKVNTNFGVSITGDGEYYLVPAYDNEIINQNNSSYKALLPRHISKVVKVGITTNTETLTDEEKQAVASWIGTQAQNIPNTLVQRYGSGNIAVPLVPTADVHATSKKYVDNGFVAKMTGTPDSGATRGFAYGMTSDGTTPKLYRVQIQANADTIPLRNSNGTFYVGTPTTQYEAANKAYVDNNFIPNPKPASNSVLLIRGGGEGKVSTSIYTNSYPFSGAFYRCAGQTEGDTMLEDASGYFLSNDPIRPYHTANKKYVDDNKGTKLYKHTITGFVGGTGVIDIPTITLISTSNAKITSASDLDLQYTLYVVTANTAYGKVVNIVQTMTDEITMQFHSRPAGGEVETVVLDASSITDDVEKL